MIPEPYKWHPTTAEALAEMQEIIEANPELSALELESVLKADFRGSTYRARYDGAPVVLKQFRGDGAARTVQTSRGELDLVASQFGDGPYRVNRCIAAFPDHGLIVLEFVPGIRLSKAIEAAEGAERDALMHQTGAWLKAYSAPRLQTGTFTPRWWLAKRREVKLGQIEAEHADILRAIRSNLTARAPELRGMPIQRGASHGDFVGINMMIHEGILYGVDIQGEAMLPLARDAARFLVWTQLHQPRAPSEAGGYVAGIAKRDLEAFLSSDILDGPGQSKLLPFFLGDQLFGRLLEGSRSGKVQHRALEMAEAFLADV